MYYKYKEDIEGGLETINSTVKDIIKETKLIINDEDLLFNLRLILNEILINAFEHGNKKDIHKLLHLSLVIDDIELKLRVKDEGDGIRNKKASNNKDELLSHGRGLLIVESLTDCFQIEDNIVRCIMRRDN